jgi:hypothetical protein
MAMLLTLYTNKVLTTSSPPCIITLCMDREIGLSNGHGKVIDYLGLLVPWHVDINPVG